MRLMYSIYNTFNKDSIYRKFRGTFETYVS